MADEGHNLLEAIMGQIKPQELQRKSHAPMPELLTGDLWSVLSSPTNVGATNKNERIIVAPDDPSAAARLTRFHELTHVMISPEGVDLQEEADSVGAHLLALQAAEDCRVHADMRNDEIREEFLDDDEAVLFTDQQKETIARRMQIAAAMGKTKGAEKEVTLVAGSMALAATDTKLEQWADEVAAECGVHPDTLAECREIVRKDMDWNASKEAARVLTRDVLFGRPEPEADGPGGDEDGEGEPMPAAPGDGKPEQTYTMAGVASPGTPTPATGELAGEGDETGVGGSFGEGQDEPGQQSGKSDEGNGKSQPGTPGDGIDPNQSGRPTVTTTVRKVERKGTEEQKQQVKQLSSKWVDWALRNAGEQGKAMRVAYRDVKNDTVNSGKPSEVKELAAVGAETDAVAPAERVFQNPIDDLLRYANGLGGSAAWGDLEIIRPKLTLPLKKVRQPNKSKTWVATDESGRLNRRVARLHTDGKVLRRKRRAKRKQREGAILIDASGSMGLNHGHLEAILEVVPMATVAHYCARSGLNKGQLYVTAERGKTVRNLKSETRVGGGNVVDGPALEWLAKQRGPRVWVSDGIVTGRNESRGGNIYREAYDLCVRHKIIRVPTLEMLLDRKGFNYRIVRS